MCTSDLQKVYIGPTKSVHPTYKKSLTDLQMHIRPTKKCTSDLQKELSDLQKCVHPTYKKCTSDLQKECKSDLSLTRAPWILQMRMARTQSCR